MAMEYVPYLEKEMPELMEEAKGIAAGAEVELAVVIEGYALIAWGNPCEYDYEKYVLE